MKSFKEFIVESTHSSLAKAGYSKTQDEVDGRTRTRFYEHPNHKHGITVESDTNGKKSFIYTQNTEHDSIDKAIKHHQDKF